MMMMMMMMIMIMIIIIIIIITITVTPHIISYNFTLEIYTNIIIMKMHAFIHL